MDQYEVDRIAQDAASTACNDLRRDMEYEIKSRVRDAVDDLRREIKDAIK